MSDERRRAVESGLPPAYPPAERRESIDEALARCFVPGASATLIEGGRIAWAAGYGVTTRGGPAVGTETIFQACSISKPVAAIALMRLVEQGRLDLDADVNDMLRSWRVPANAGWQPRVTLRQLLSHTAGLTTNWYPGYRRGRPVPTLLQTLNGEPPSNTPPVRVIAVPGTRFQYSGSHFSVIQQVLVDVTGRAFPDLMHELVFDPLGMRDSSYDQHVPETRPGAVALGHDDGGDPIAGEWRIQQEMAGAGLWTTPSDLARLAIDVHLAAGGGPARLLSQATARAMLAPQVAGRGLGWQVMTLAGRSHFAHGGSNIGYRCYLICDAEAGDGIAVMTNGERGVEIWEGLLRAAARVYGRPLPDILREDPRQNPAEAVTTDEATLAGVYETDAGARLEVTHGAQGLALRAPGQPPIPLRPLADDTFATPVVDAILRVRREDDGVSGFILVQDGTELTATRRS